MESSCAKIVMARGATEDCQGQVSESGDFRKLSAIPTWKIIPVNRIINIIICKLVTVG